MFCEFTKIGDSHWLCKNCGRAAEANNEKYAPNARCRIPENYKLYSGYVGNERLLGVGDELAIIIKKLGYSFPPIGRVRARLTLMNKRGPDWCEANKSLILEWFKQECPSRGVIFNKKVTQALIRLAIYKARTQRLSLV